MPRKTGPVGHIQTFFSYKGGVGRTMALSNVGFIAAMSGLRVLLMDWDLEAPGLAVYFRGLTDHSAAADIRRAKGVLDIFRDWQDEMQRSSSRSSVDKVVRRFRSGKPFADCVRPLVAASRLPATARLDLIGAGGATVGTHDPLPYPEALARFSWSSFFEDVAGGVMLQALRNWCKKHYDVILVDSRTGLADVAGVCTMQLPDSVVLCFVLNRQNTEGIAQVAAAIKQTRGDEVAVRLSPMRVSKDRPTEEADARFRAQREMRRAGLDPVLIEEDMTKLAIGAASNMPFYETLAPFAATSVSADPLTFEYLRMAQLLVGRDLPPPKVNPGWADEVRRRLQPRMTTPEYLASLETADPERALEELERFLEGAMDADPARELDSDYVQALVRAAMEFLDWAWDDDNEPKAEELARKALALLRQLNDVGDGDWRLPLVDAMDEYDGRFGISLGTSVQKLNEERDAILANGEQTDRILLRRVALRLADARSLGLEKRGLRQVERHLTAAEDLLGKIEGNSDDLAKSVAMSEANIATTRAGIALAEGNNEEASRQSWFVIERTREIDLPRAKSLTADAFLRLAEAMPRGAPDVARHVIAAVQAWRGCVLRDVDTFSRAIDMLVSSDQSGRAAIDFAMIVFGRARGSSSVPRILDFTSGRKFAVSAEKLALAIFAAKASRRDDALAAIGEAADLAFHRLTRLSYQRRSAQDVERFQKLLSAYWALVDTLASSGVSRAKLKRLTSRLAAADPTIQSPS